MNKRLVLTLLLLASFVTQAAAPDNDTDRFNLAAVDGQIIPAYRALAEATAHLDETARKACTTSTYADTPLKKAFIDAFLAWQSAQQIRFGPIDTLNRGFRYQLWPDKRGTVGKHLRQLLATQDQSRLQRETFASGSIAIQGFGALERLLFDPGPPKDTDALAWHCAVVGAIAANLKAMSGELLNEWQVGPDAQRGFIATASAGNIYYDSAQEVSAKLLNSLHTQLEFMATQKLDRPLGKSIERARPKRAEAWRSSLSLDALRTNLEAAQSLYRAAFAPRLTNKGLIKQFDQGFTDAMTTAQAIEPPLAEAVSTAEHRRQVERLRGQIATLQSLVGERLTRALELSLGFNSLDGD